MKPACDDKDGEFFIESVPWMSPLPYAPAQLVCVRNHEFLRESIPFDESRFAWLIDRAWMRPGSETPRKAASAVMS
jgi:hypothetical protein